MKCEPDYESNKNRLRILILSLCLLGISVLLYHIVGGTALVDILKPLAVFGMCVAGLFLLIDAIFFFLDNRYMR